MYSKFHLALFALAATPVLAQDVEKPCPHARWEEAIARFEAADKENAPPQDAFLFVGSSSIRLWDLPKSFPEAQTVNRGFGGSEIADSIHFAERIIVAHKPHTVVLYAGDNDIAKGKNADTVISDFDRFVERVRKDLPETHIAFIAIKPSLKRWEMWPEMKKANAAIAARCGKEESLTFLDIAAATLGEDGKPKPEMFVDDGLHCSEAGYEAWANVVRPFLQSRKEQRESTKKTAEAKPTPPAPELNPSGAIDDARIRARFARLLGDLRDAGETVSAKDLAKQLAERQKAAIPAPPATAPAGASLSPAGVYQLCVDSVLCFGSIYKCDRCDKWHASIAGGFVISEDGLAVTNHHVLESDKAAAFAAMDRSGNLYPVIEVIAASERDDVAVVRLAGSGFSPVGLSTDALPGAPVTAITHPDGQYFTVSTGIISRLYRSMERGAGRGATRVAITADFARGSSGAPVFDSSGRVIGVVASTRSVYYSKEKGVDSNLQMVLKTCIPTSAILSLFEPDKTENTDS